MAQSFAANCEAGSCVVDGRLDGKVMVRYFFLETNAEVGLFILLPSLLFSVRRNSRSIRLDLVVKMSHCPDAFARQSAYLGFRDPGLPDSR